MTTTIAPTSARAELDRLLARQHELTFRLSYLEQAATRAATAEQAEAFRLELAADRPTLGTVENLVIRARVRLYRETVENNPENLDDVDIVMWLVNESGRSWTASEIGRYVGMETITARNTLVDLELTGYIRSDDRGARTRWSAR